MTKPFKVLPFTNIDKRVEIEGPDYLRIFVDFDDVNHATVRKQIKLMVGILNREWANAEKVAQETKASRKGAASQDQG